MVSQFFLGLGEILGTPSGLSLLTGLKLADLF